MKSQKAKEFIDGCMAHLTVEMSDHAKWQLRAAMTHAAELAEQEMEGFYTCWIDPKDFMPEANKNVLVKCSSGEIQTDFYAPELGGFFIEHSTHAKVTGWTRGGTPTKPKHTEESIQQALYWNHPILTKPAFEMVGFIFYAWESDYLAISKAGYVYECEIKISHSDFLNEAIHKQNKMRILQGLSASDGTIDDRRPNYFWYVCPEGIISEAECPKFAGLMYITDSGTFRCIKSAPCLHKAKYDTQADLLRRDMRDKFYYAMWNWIRRYWRNIGKAKDIAPQTAAAYERALDKQVEEVADLKYRLSSLTQWRDIQADPKWGFATDDAIDEIFRNLPRLVRDKRDGSIELIDYDNAAEWRGDLERKPSLYQWLPINGNTL